MPKIIAAARQVKAFIEKAADGKIRIVATDETVDRVGESLNFDSWDLTNFQKAPRLLIDHDYKVEKIVGRAVDVTKDPVRKAIVFTPEFHDITENAKMTKQMVEQDFCNTVSVGYNEHIDMKGNVVKRDLMEISFVAVPCNPNALTLGMKQSKAIREFVGETLPAKGIIDDTLDMSEELAEDKYPIVNAIWSAMYEFMAAFWSDSVDASQAQAFIADLCEKLTAIGEMQPDEEPDEMNDGYVLLAGMAAAQKFVSAHMGKKAGASISKKNRDIIKDVIAHCESACESAKSLIEDEQEQTDDAGDAKAAGDAPQNQRSNDGNAKHELRKWFETRDVLASVATAINGALSEHNARKPSKK